MSLPRSVAEVLRDHVTLEVEGIDRMYLNVMVPILQTERGSPGSFAIAGDTVRLLGADGADDARPSSRPSKTSSSPSNLAVITFEKGQRKDDVAAEYRARFRGEEGVLFVGKAQEKTPVFRTEKRRKNPTTGRHVSLDRPSTAMVNQFYFYCSTTTSARSSSSSAPTSPTTPSSASTATSTSSGSSAKEGSPSRPWTTASCPAPTRPRCSRSATGCRPPRSTRCCASGWADCRIPSRPRIAQAGYRYDVSILQAEFSLTQVLDRPLTGRVFFEEVIRENLDIGRPDQVQLIFDRRIVRKVTSRPRADSARGC